MAHVTQVIRAVGTLLFAAIVLSFATLIASVEAAPPAEAESGLARANVDPAVLADRAQKAADNANERSAIQLEAARKSQPQASTDSRKMVCENRKNTIQNKVQAFGGSASSHLTRLQDVYGKLQTYKREKQVAADAMQYDIAVRIADEKEAEALTNVAALQQLLPDSLDCESAEVAQSLNTVKIAAHVARQSLQDFRMAIKDVLTQLTAVENQTVSVEDER